MSDTDREDIKQRVAGVASPREPGIQRLVLLDELEEAKRRRDSLTEYIAALTKRLEDADA